jgi:2,3-bisphosphoglycerate-dependent phosphoglycerate mutase
MLWRRSYDTPPPPLDPTMTSSARPATRGTPTSTARTRPPSASRTSWRACCPTGRARSSPTWAGKVVLVAAHGNSLRAMVKHLDGISDEDIAG